MTAGDEATDPGAGLPWAFVLDPAANAAALGEVQRRGLDAARRLVDRALARSDRSADRDPPGPGDPDGRGRREEEHHQPELVTELIRCWTELTAQVLAKLAEDRPCPPPAETDEDQRTAVAVDGSGGRASIRLGLDDDAGGRLHAASEILLDNPLDRTVGPLILRVFDLHTADGRELGGGCVTFDPPVLDELAAGSSRVVGVTVSADRRMAAGTYRGVIQCVGAPAFSLTLQVEVKAPGP
jgi:hypothetical protein